MVWCLTFHQAVVWIMVTYNAAMRGYWARDDPAVLLIVLAFLAGEECQTYTCASVDYLSSFMAVSSIVYSFWLRLRVASYFIALLWVVGFDGLLAGAIIASFMW